MKAAVSIIILLGALAAPAQRTAAGESTTGRPPNIIVVLADDMGYGDAGCYGSTTVRTPHLDRMAAEGIRFTNCYAQPICTASRAALMTGSYPLRCGLPDVHAYGSPFGLDPGEVTIAEVLKSRGYATACVGKWHLGEALELGPNRQGFDYYYGNRLVNGTQPFETFAVPIWRNETMLTPRPDHSRFTADFQREAMQFIEENRERPFFLYLAHFAPHMPVYPGTDFRRRSGHGLFTDAVEEIDFYLGRMLDRLKQLGLEDNTLVVFTSDNGPWAGYGEQSGTAGPLRGSKMTTWEGGFRVPFVVRWPGHVASGRVSDEIVTLMDLFPTFASLAGAPLPDHKIDGHNIWPLLAATPGARSPTEAFYYYAGSWLQAVRAGKWKLQLARTKLPEPRYGWCAGWFMKGTTLMEQDQLYDLDADIGESKDVADEHPDVVARLRKLANAARKDIGDYDVKGEYARPMGSALAKYQDPASWPHSVDSRAVTKAMVEEMRSFQRERYHVLLERPPVDPQEEAEIAYYHKLFGADPDAAASK